MHDCPGPDHGPVDWHTAPCCGKPYADLRGDFVALVPDQVTCAGTTVEVVAESGAGDGTGGVPSVVSGPTGPDDPCRTYWGSHGCGCPQGHGLPHVCGTDDDPCSEHDGERVRYHHPADGTWSEWMPSVTFTM